MSIHFVIEVLIGCNNEDMYIYLSVSRRRIRIYIYVRRKKHEKFPKLQSFKSMTTAVCYQSRKVTKLLPAEVALWSIRRIVAPHVLSQINFRVGNVVTFIARVNLIPISGMSRLHVTPQVA